MNLLGWFTGRCKWLQEAAARPLHRGSVDDGDMAGLAMVCLQEAGKELEPTALAFPCNAFTVSDVSSLRLRSMGAVPDSPGGISHLDRAEVPEELAAYCRCV